MTTPHDAETNPTTVSTPSASEMTVGRIDGVRPCLQCGHDLHGQAIVREATYGLLIARCPECGTVAALSEHPRLGIWGKRLGATLMATMLTMLIPLLLLTALAIFGVAAGIYDETARDGRTALTAMTSENPLGPDRITPEWWATNGDQARRAVVEEVLILDSQERMILLFLLAVPLLLGVLWSGILVGVPRRRLWIVAVASGAVALFYLWIGTVDDQRLGVDPVWYSTAVFQIIAWPLMGGVILIQTGLMAIGLLIGRPLLRRLAGFVLPPRARRTMAFLWTIDGLEPPRGRG